MTTTHRVQAMAGILAAVLAAPIVAQTRPGASEPAASPDARPTVVITGANRGLGLEFARQFSAAGFEVIGTARRPDKADDLRSLGVRIEQLDVTDAQSVEQFAAAIGDHPVDILINNAGVGGRVLSINDMDAARVRHIFEVNCLGPMRVTQVLLPALRAGDRKLIVNITSMLGSIERNTRGGYYGYRESKAALNMFTRSLAAELEPEGFTCIVMNPGWVRTDLGGSQARLSPAESIGAMITVIDGLTPADTGAFFSYGGERVPW